MIPPRPRQSLNADGLTARRHIDKERGIHTAVVDSALQQVERGGVAWPRQRITEDQHRHEIIYDCDRG